MSAPITPSDITYARRLARSYALRRFPGFDPDEAESIGMLALVETARRWRPDGGASLIALAHRRICGAIVDAHREDLIHEGHAHEPPRGDERVMLGEVAAVKLPPKLETLLVCHRMGGETLERVGQRLGITESWASRLNAKLTVELNAQLGRRAA